MLDTPFVVLTPRCLGNLDILFSQHASKQLHHEKAAELQSFNW